MYQNYNKNSGWLLPLPSFLTVGGEPEDPCQGTLAPSGEQLSLFSLNGAHLCSVRLAQCGSATERVSELCSIVIWG